jgi:pyruvate/2-oxoglutarate/acetoin dehydrogenase E1 component
MAETVLSSLNAGLLAALGSDDRVYLLGEDILDPYGGSFKVTRGCSSAFPQRVITTPISEAGLAGVSAGMALRGLRPVLEIMFGDFLTLTFDQLVNHISKFRWMYNNTVNLPLVIRTPMGGRRGYGPTHSQTLEKLFMGVPGLTVAAPVNLVDAAFHQTPGDLLESLILHSNDPVLFIENKLQYLLPVYQSSDLADLEISAALAGTGPEPVFPVYKLTVAGAPAAKVTLTAYGYMAELARQAMLQLAYEEELFCELIIPTRLAPFEATDVVESVQRTGRLVTIEEAGLALGWGAEVTARVAESLPGERLVTRRVAARDLPVPAAPSLEKRVLPQVEDILQAVRKVANHGK